MSGGGNFGISTAIQVLQNIQQAIVGLSTVITKITAILASNNTWTGANTFTNTTDLTGAVNFSGVATTFSGATTEFEGATSFKPPPTISMGVVGTGTFLPTGFPSAQTAGAGSGNGADTTDDTLFAYTMPARSLDQQNRGVIIEAWGDLAANGNNKTVKLWLGTATICTTGVIATTGGGWWLRAVVIKDGAGSNQACTSFGIVGAAVVPGASLNLESQTDTSPIIIKVTGASPTSGAADDVLGYAMTVQFMN